MPTQQQNPIKRIIAKKFPSRDALIIFVFSFHSIFFVPVRQRNGGFTSIHSDLDSSRELQQKSIQLFFLFRMNDTFNRAQVK